MSTDRGKLGEFLKEVINWRWDEFVAAEKSKDYTGYQATVLSLVRICSDGKLGAIKLAIDRVDGKLETPVKIEYPKIYLVYPHAESVAELPPGEATTNTRTPSLLPEIPPEGEELSHETVEEEHTEVVNSLRDTLHRLAEAPRLVTQLILARKTEVEETDGPIVDSNDAAKKIPLVVSVIAANLLNLANDKGNFEAITEVFEQIDGKLVETLRILGDDIFLVQYGLEAPYGAEKNKSGVYMVEQVASASVWEEKLKAKHGK